MKTNSFSIGITKGVIFAILGLLLIIYPIQVVKTVTTIFGIASLITGAFVLYSAISKRGKGESTAVFQLIEGALSVIYSSSCSIYLPYNPCNNGRCMGNY